MEVFKSNSPHDRALELPLNLTVKQCAEHLGIKDLKRVRRLLKEIYYVPRKLSKEHMTPEKKVKQWVINWSEIDWSKKNVDIAKETGVSRWTIAKRRRAMT